MLIAHDIQVNLLWFIELLVCAVALFGSLVSKHRAAYILTFSMVALDLYLWSFFDSLPSGPDRYFACLAMSSIFILANIMFVKGKRLLKNLKLLVVLSLLHSWEAIDVALNPDKSFIDSNYALLIAMVYLIYSISLMGRLHYDWRNNDRFVHRNHISLSRRNGDTLHHRGRKNTQGKG